MLWNSAHLPQQCIFTLLMISPWCLSGWRIPLRFSLPTETKVSSPMSGWVCVSATPWGKVLMRRPVTQLSEIGLKTWGINFLSQPGFNRQRWILRCQWVRRRYSQHLREVTADVMRFPAPRLSYTSATLNSMKAAGDYVYECSVHGSLKKMGPVSSVGSVSHLSFSPQVVIASLKTCPWFMVSKGFSHKLKRKM